MEGLLFANARLLGLGYGSEDAVERSYVEDFTVIPPVFLHETAEIENSVVGPSPTWKPGPESTAASYATASLAAIRPCKTPCLTDRSSAPGRE
jgi:hypothetical protein